MRVALKAEQRAACWGSQRVGSLGFHWVDWMDCQKVANWAVLKGAARVDKTVLLWVEYSESQSVALKAG
jgi:hypothetical protein